jgi:prolyl oligopeptidase
VTDVYFGTNVVDRYRWMERGTEDSRFMPFLKEQSAYTTSLLAPLARQHDALREKLLALSAGVAHVVGWQQAGDKLFFEQLDPAAAVPVLRVRDADGTTRTLFDPAVYASAASHAAIDYFAPSFDGSYIAIGVSLGGSENDTIRVVDTKTGQTLPDTISRTQYGSPSWREDGTSFYYSRLQPVAVGESAVGVYKNQRVYLHVLGSDADKDKAVFGPGVVPALSVPAAGFNAVSVVPGYPVLIAFHSAGTTDPGSIYVSSDAGKTWTLAIMPSDHLATSGSSPFALRGSKLYALLQNVPNGRVVAYDLTNLHAAPATIVQSGDAVIEGVFGTKDGLYVEHRNGLTFGISKISDAGAPLGDIDLPFQGSVFGIDASPTEAGLRFAIDSWTRPPALFTYDPASRNVIGHGRDAEGPVRRFALGCA